MKIIIIIVLNQRNLMQCNFCAMISKAKFKPLNFFLSKMCLFSYIYIFSAISFTFILAYWIRISANYIIAGKSYLTHPYPSCGKDKNRECSRV